MVVEPREIQLPTVAHVLGDLTFVEGGNHIPFPIRRVFFIHHIPAHAERGGHANKINHSLIVPVAGALTITVESQTGAVFRKRLDNPAIGLHNPPLHWLVMNEFAPGTVYLVLASEPYDPADYLRDYSEFKSYR